MNNIFAGDFFQIRDKIKKLLKKLQILQSQVKYTTNIIIKFIKDFRKQILLCERRGHFRDRVKKFSEQQFPNTSSFKSNKNQR